MSAERILVVHNAYLHRGGEDSVVEAEVALLASKGHEVRLFLRSNDEIGSQGRVRTAVDTLWSTRSAHAIEQAVADFRPDVIHVHNTFPLISPSIYWAADELGVPIVQTLHNFRLHCPQAMYLRNGKVCEDCLGHVPWHGVLRGCYRGSRTQSAVMTAMLTFHRTIGTWNRKVTRYIALNEFCRNKFIEGGLPAERVLVKPNFVDFPRPEPLPREGFLFVGRLSAEKGVATLVDAFGRVAGSSLRIAGTGPEDRLLAGVPGLNWLGALPGDQVHREMMSAAALVLPSIWYENFPRTLVEAMASGLPVIASRCGALAELVEDGVTGLLFEPGQAADLEDKMRWAIANPERLAAMGRAARLRYEARYTADINYGQLTAIYREAIACRAAES